MSVPTSQLANTPMILLGRIGAPWGVKGHNRIQSYTAPMANILEYETWFLRKDSGDTYRPVEVVDFKDSGNRLVAKLKGIETPEQAQTLVHAKIYVPREAMPECAEDEYYWCDLKGLEVICQERSLGLIESLYETGAHDNMIVAKGSKKTHIPFVMGDTVLEVDLSAGKVTVDWELG